MLTDYHVHLRPDEPDTPPSATSPTRTSTRYRAAADAAGIAELGISEHIHRFRQALEIWRHPFWVEQAIDDLDAYCEFLAAAGLTVGIEADYVAGAEERIDAVLAARALRLRDRLGPLRRRGRGRPGPLGRLGGGGRRPRPGLVALLRAARRAPPAPGSSTSSPIPTWSRSGARRGPAPSATRAASTSPPSRRSPRPASPSRSRPRACASRSASSTRRAAFAELLRRGRASRSRSPPTPTSPSTSATPTIEAVEFMRAIGVERDLRLRGPRAPDGAARMSAPGRDRLRQPPASPRAGR